MYMGSVYYGKSLYVVPFVNAAVVFRSTGVGCDCPGPRDHHEYNVYSTAGVSVGHVGQSSKWLWRGILASKHFSRRT